MKIPYADKLNGETRFAVYASGIMLAFITVVRIVNIHLNGVNDLSLLQVQQALVTLFTGSIVLDRSQIKKKVDNINGTTSGTTKPESE